MARFFDERAARDGQFHLARGALEQPHAERVFEFFDASRQRQWRQVERVCGGADTTGIGGSDEGAKVGEIEVHRLKRGCGGMDGMSGAISKPSCGFESPDLATNMLVNVARGPGPARPRSSA
ncbi:hypothetical protein FHX59_005019 [Paraburkholderia silvatlantica]|uniref:Uncharacterized protein n=1 Tax=Paraburkholderia silvatlantica TaxID=321895 RepID=A0ABR6FSZ3_9BURK|nr:hypothetical protein [Paraburkholderia silvatlantica]